MTCIDPQTRCVLFILLTNDTPVTVIASDSDIDNVHVTVNMELVGIDNWLKANRLMYIIFNLKNAFNITIKDSILMRVSTIKFLGGTLD